MKKNLLSVFAVMVVMLFGLTLTASAAGARITVQTNTAWGGGGWKAVGRQPPARRGRAHQRPEHARGSTLACRGAGTRKKRKKRT